MRIPRERVLIGIVAFVAVFIALKAAFHWAQMLMLEARGPLDHDVMIYLTIGRSLLNGLAPYTALFESKPPGMFFLMALSLFFTGTAKLAVWFQAGILLSFPLMLSSLAFVRTGPKALRPWNIFVAAIAFSLGALLTLYLDDKSFGVQTETFGAFFAALYVLHLLLFGDRGGWKDIVVRGFFLLGSIGMKEPFVLTTFAAALLVCPDLRSLMRGYLVPLAAGACMGFVVLLLLGYLPDYLGMYLPSMLKYRIGGTDPYEGFWLRGLSIRRLYADTVSFATAPIFGLILGGLWVFSPIFRKREWQMIPVAVSALQGLLLFFVIHILYQLCIYVQVLEHPEARPVFDDLLVRFLFAAPVALGLLWWQWRKGFLYAALTALVSLYCTSLAVGIAQYLHPHFMFAFPVYIALIALFVRYAISSSANIPLVLLVAITTVATVVVYSPNPKHAETLTALLRNSSEEYISLSAKADQLMESCGFERYGSLDVYREMAYTKHSPVGPLLNPTFHKYLGEDHLFFQQTRDNVAAAPVVFRGDDSIVDMFTPILQADFTKEIPACAEPFLPLGTITVYFHK